MGRNYTVSIPARFQAHGTTDKRLRLTHAWIRWLERARVVHGETEASTVLSEMHRALGMRQALDFLGLPGPEGATAT